MIATTIYTVRTVHARGIVVTALIAMATDNVQCAVLLNVPKLLAPEALLWIGYRGPNRHPVLPHAHMGR